MGGGIERVGVCVVGLLLVVLVSYWYLLLLVGWLVAYDRRISSHARINGVLSWSLIFVV